MEQNSVLWEKVVKSGKAKKKGGWLVANFLPPFVNILEQFLLFFYTYMVRMRALFVIYFFYILNKSYEGPL